MSYSLGVDLGNTYVAAAVERGSEIEMCTLGESSIVMPAVVHIGEDGTVTVGDPAVRRGLAQPERLARGPRRRLGDPPVVINGRAHAVAELLATLLRAVLTKVTEQQGEAPGRVVLAYPGFWDPVRRALFDEAVRLAGLDEARTVTEAEAVATQYAASRGLEDGRVLAVYDLGGGTFDVSLVRKSPGGIGIMGAPQGFERLGGLDFDEALVDLVDDSLGGPLRKISPDDPGATRFPARLREQCEHAKEALTSDDVVDISVSVGVKQFDTCLTRADLEKVIGPYLQSTLHAVREALDSAQLPAERLDGILLVGGSSRIPLVARTIAEAFSCPVRTNVCPKNLVALGAATSSGAAARRSPSRPSPASPATPFHLRHRIWLRPGPPCPPRHRRPRPLQAFRSHLVHRPRRPRGSNRPPLRHWARAYRHPGRSRNLRISPLPHRRRHRARITRQPRRSAGSRCSWGQIRVSIDLNRVPTTQLEYWIIRIPRRLRVNIQPRS